MEGNDVPMGRAHPVDLWRQLLRILLFRDLYYNQKQEKLTNVYHGSFKDLGSLSVKFMPH